MNQLMPDVMTLTLLGKPAEFHRGRAGAYWLVGQHLLGVFLVEMLDGTEMWDGRTPATFEGWNRQYADLIYDDGSPECEHLFRAAANALHRDHECQLNYFPLRLLGDEIEYSPDYSPAVDVGRLILGEYAAAEAEPLDDFGGEERTEPGAALPIMEPEPDLLGEARAGLVSVIAAGGLCEKCVGLPDEFKGCCQNPDCLACRMTAPGDAPDPAIEPETAATVRDMATDVWAGAMLSTGELADLMGFPATRPDVVAAEEPAALPPPPPGFLGYLLPTAPPAVTADNAEEIFGKGSEMALQTIGALGLDPTLPKHLRGITDAELKMLLEHRGVHKIGDFKALGARLGFGFSAPKTPRPPRAKPPANVHALIAEGVAPGGGLAGTPTVWPKALTPTDSPAPSAS